jgi:hypothetical protein
MHLRGAQSEDRNSSSQKTDAKKSTPLNARASISKEVNTSTAL